MTWKEPKNKINKKGKPVAGRHSDVLNKGNSYTITSPIEPMFESENEYDHQANSFLRKHVIRFKAVKKADKCPLFCDGKHIHGERHLITFSKGTKRLSLSFWNSLSLNDTQNEKAVRPYDVLTSIQKYNPGDFDNFVGDYGYERFVELRSGALRTNIKTKKIYEAVVKEWKKVNAFFTDEELKELREIN